MSSLVPPFASSSEYTECILDNLHRLALVQINELKERTILIFQTSFGGEYF